MKLSALLDILEQIAPLKLAESWDNVGLLAGNPAANISRVMLTIDYTAEVARETKAAKCDLVIAYHPPIFEPLKRLNAGTPVFDAIAAGIALYSPHTALDVAEGGTNDMLADVVAMLDRAPLRINATPSTQYKLVTFVPPDHAEKVSNAIFRAGAGRIGNYTSCSFFSPGRGTFFGDSTTRPSVGRRGRLEIVNELRLETIVPISQIEPVIRALRAAHPYEEPAFDLIQLAAAPEGFGMGRIGALKPISRPHLFTRIKRGLGIKNLLIAGPTTGDVQCAAVCAGSCGNLLNDAIAAKADLLLTGEVRHHDALKAAAAGMTVVCALHSNSERPVLRRLKLKLEEQVPKLKVQISRSDRDPFMIG
jgi:dinuclear metal center YbgI/SA1388 family protein